LTFAVIAGCRPDIPGAGRHEIFVTSTLDASLQPSYLIVPENLDPGVSVPLVVSLHSWSYGYEQRVEDLEQEVTSRGWLYLFPHFRGRNDHPEACGSELARQDILDAVDWVYERYDVDEDRIYLTGNSGGGFMTMLMAGLHPDRWTAASAWVGISDLAAWYRLREGDRYGEMMRQCFGGAPGDGPEVEAAYIARSPITHLASARNVSLDISAGRHDGHQGSVPVRHSLEAFNVIARAAGAEPISEEEIAQISRPDGRLDHPLPKDEGDDTAFGRAYYLRRFTGRTRVTIFEGGHEGIAPATIDWFERH